MKYFTFYLGFVIISVFSQRCAEGANILAVFPRHGKSVNMLYQRLLKGFADAGHDVTTISSHEFEPTLLNGSVRDVLLTGFAEEFENMNTDVNYETEGIESTSLFENDKYMKMFLDVYNRTFHHPNVQRFLKLKPKFDLVITEHFWSESLLAFASKFNCPSVVFTGLGGINPFVNNMVGNPMPPSYVPHHFLLGDFSKGLSFFERCHNLLFYCYDIVFNYFYSFPAHNKVIESWFKKNPPDIAKLYHNVSLILSVSHLSMSQATPIVPNVVEIGGFHIDPPKELPKDLQRYLDDAKNGAIYFSMGSVIQSKHFSNERKKVFINVFRKLNLKVIWKYEDTDLLNKPTNVFIKKWVPQTDILGHPNIKLFISHGGYTSMLETVYHGVPALMIPIFFDQFNNAYHAHEQGYALKLPYNDINFTEDTLYSLITELLENPKYAENAKSKSNLFHDRPMKPIDAAVYWIEYVIRHKGADHLRVAAIKMPLYQFYMLDVILFSFLVILSVPLSTYVYFNN